MAPPTTQASIRLTEPVVFLEGGSEYERARGRRRRTTRQGATPSNSRPGSRAPSRAASPGPGISTLPGHDDFVPPGPHRGRTARDSSRSRGDSGLAGAGSRNASRTRFTTEGTTTGGGTMEEGEAADEPPPALLRGLLTLTLAKPSRIRDISIRLRGVARTDWPEGIGPRRLDVSEETILCSTSWIFFSAAALSNERRAVSIGPGVIEAGQDIDPRGRTGARRSASMMPTRDTSAGLAYSARDSAIHEEEHPSEPYQAAPSRAALSRITSSTNLDSLDTEDASDRPPVATWGPSPAYEAVSSQPNSPAQGPSSPNTLGRISSIDSFELGSRRSPSLQPRIHSPLNPSFPSDHSRNGRPSTSHSTLSQEDSIPYLPSPPIRSFSESSTTESGGHSSAIDTSDTDGGERGRPSRRDGVPTIPATTPMSLQASTSTRLDLMRTTSAGSGHSANSPSISSAFRSMSSVRNGDKATTSSDSTTGRSASSRPSARFSFAGLSDVLRGKSTSRVRESSLAREDGSGRRSRAESPDTRGGGPGRSESRGRKTALKVLRETLTNGGEAGQEGDSEEEDEESAKTRSKGWKEFRAGTYTYPISIPIPASLPPTIASEFGNVTYMLKATIHRAGALTPNLTSTVEVCLVSCPGQDDTEESESIVVERFWETQMKYHIALSGKSFPIGGTIPICIRLNPMAKIKLYRITVILEEKTNYFASGRKLTRHELPKKYPLLRIEMPDPKEPLLPILSDSVDAIKTHPLAHFFINPTSSDDTTPSLLDPIGPWQLESILRLPDCVSKLNFSTNHDKANITVSHVLKILLRVERGDDDFLDTKGKRKLWDVIIETPLHILSCRCTQNALPAYSYSAMTSSIHTQPASSSSLAPTPHCSFDHSAPPPARGMVVGSTSRARSVTPAPVATLEQNLLFARLVAGEETPAGEVPPTYDAVITGAARGRRNSSTSTIMTARGGRSGSQGSPGGSDRGRSGSVGVNGRSGSAGPGRSPSVGARASSLFGRG